MVLQVFIQFVFEGRGIHNYFMLWRISISVLRHNGFLTNNCFRKVAEVEVVLSVVTRRSRGTLDCCLCQLCAPMNSHFTINGCVSSLWIMIHVISAPDPVVFDNFSRDSSPVRPRVLSSCLALTLHCGVHINICFVIRRLQ